MTHSIGEYRLVFKQGEPFRPVALRVHGDPISIIGKVLDQNPRSCTKINDFLQIGKEMVSLWFLQLDEGDLDLFYHLLNRLCGY